MKLGRDSLDPDPLPQVIFFLISFGDEVQECLLGLIKKKFFFFSKSLKQKEGNLKHILITDVCFY